MKIQAGESFALHMEAKELCDNVVAKAHAKEDTDKHCLICAGAQLRPEPILEKNQANQRLALAWAGSGLGYGARFKC